MLLTDFGIAKSTDEVQHLTGTGNLLATLAYASPEQIEARPLDHRVDIYALGCVLYELLTGSVPLPGGLAVRHHDGPSEEPAAAAVGEGAVVAARLRRRWSQRRWRRIPTTGTTAAGS